MVDLFLTYYIQTTYISPPPFHLLLLDNGLQWRWYLFTTALIVMFMILSEYAIAHTLCAGV